MNGVKTSGLYRVRGMAGWDTEIQIVREYPQGYDILISTTTETSVRESAEFIARDLFETCLRTGYLIPYSPPVSTAAAGA